MTDFANSRRHETTVADAFRSPTTAEAQKSTDGLRLRVHTDKQISVRRIEPTGWSAFWAFIFPDATIVEISGRLNVTLKVYPTHVQADERRWFSSTMVLARYNVEIPVYDEVGDAVIHRLRVKSALAFLYPFVPMHVEVALDDETIFSQGKFSDGPTS